MDSHRAHSILKQVAQELLTKLKDGGNREEEKKLLGIRGSAGRIWLNVAQEEAHRQLQLHAFIHPSAPVDQSMSYCYAVMPIIDPSSHTFVNQKL